MSYRTNVFLDSWTAAQRVDQLVTRELKAAGVWTPHYALLSMICIREPITPRELAEEMGIAPTTLSDRLHELRALGHIRRTRNPGDGRSYLIRSTAAGGAQWSVRRPSRCVHWTRSLPGSVVERTLSSPRSTSSSGRSTPSSPSPRPTKALHKPFCGVGCTSYGA